MCEKEGGVDACRGEGCGGAGVEEEERDVNEAEAAGKSEDVDEGRGKVADGEAEGAWKAVEENDEDVCGYDADADPDRMCPAVVDGAYAYAVPTSTDADKGDPTPVPDPAPTPVVDNLANDVVFPRTRPRALRKARALKHGRAKMKGKMLPMAKGIEARASRARRSILSARLHPIHLPQPREARGKGAPGSRDAREMLFCLVRVLVLRVPIVLKVKVLKPLTVLVPMPLEMKVLVEARVKVKMKKEKQKWIMIDPPIPTNAKTAIEQQLKAWRDMRNKLKERRRGAWSAMKVEVEKPEEVEEEVDVEMESEYPDPDPGVDADADEEDAYAYAGDGDGFEYEYAAADDGDGEGEDEDTAAGADAECPWWRRALLLLLLQKARSGSKPERATNGGTLRERLRRSGRRGWRSAWRRGAGCGMGWGWGTTRTQGTRGKGTHNNDKRPVRARHRGVRLQLLLQLQLQRKQVPGRVPNARPRVGESARTRGRRPSKYRRGVCSGGGETKDKKVGGRVGRRFVANDESQSSDPQDLVGEKNIQNPSEQCWNRRRASELSAGCCNAMEMADAERAKRSLNCCGDGWRHGSGTATARISVVRTQPINQAASKTRYDQSPSITGPETGSLLTLTACCRTAWRRTQEDGVFHVAVVNTARGSGAGSRGTHVVHTAHTPRDPNSDKAWPSQKSDYSREYSASGGSGELILKLVSSSSYSYSVGRRASSPLLKHGPFIAVSNTTAFRHREQIIIGPWTSTVLGSRPSTRPISLHLITIYNPIQHC
ncbi:hypothetical protein DFH06DRAFT_1128465 [Mycena polygramma]|nr:hypothetical protein DFH06DRAFT_1128465 [Mycena polygramma]